MKKILSLFHHVHHKNGDHKIHHCGGDHKNSKYKIKHCSCKKHSISKKKAKGHDFNKKEVLVEFFEKCPKKGWHVESGKILSS